MAIVAEGLRHMAEAVVYLVAPDADGIHGVHNVQFTEGAVPGDLAMDEGGTRGNPLSPVGAEVAVQAVKPRRECRVIRVVAAAAFQIVDEHVVLEGLPVEV